MQRLAYVHSDKFFFVVFFVLFCFVFSTSFIERRSTVNFFTFREEPFSKRPWYTVKQTGNNLIVSFNKTGGKSTECIYIILTHLYPTLI